MRKIRIYEYKNCGTCKKALRFLDTNQISYEKISILDKPPTKTELRRMLSFVDGNMKKLFNTSGTVYRDLHLSDKIKEMSETDLVNLLAGNSKLIKRPFVLLGKTGLVGFNEDEWRDMFNAH